MSGKSLFFFVLAFVAFAGKPVFAQASLFISFPRDSLSAPNGAMVGTSVKITNYQDRFFNGKLILSASEVLGIVGSQEEKIALMPNDSTFVSINMIISQTASAGMDYGFAATLYDSEGGLVFRKEIIVSVAESKKMKFYILKDQVLLEGNGKLLEIPVRLVNEGNTPQEVVLLVKLPTEIQSGFFDRKNIMVPAFQDTVITIQKKITRKMMSVDYFTIDVTALYKKGDMIGRERVQATTIKTVRKFRPPGEIFPIRENQFALRARSPGEENASYEGQLNTEIELPKEGFIELNANATWRQQIDELFFRNTWIGYRNKQFGGRIGNIYKDYGISVNGRGGEVFLNSEDGKRHYEIGAVDKAYLLFEGSPFGGGSFWGGYRSETDKKHFYANFVYDADPLQNHKKLLVWAHRSLVAKKNLVIDGGAATGFTGLYVSDTTRKLGAAAELKLTANVGNFSFFSHNFISTSYFPGRRRGGMNLSERVSYGFKDYSFYAFFNHYGYSPKYLGQPGAGNSEFGHSSAQVGVSRKWPLLTISLFPSYSHESRTIHPMGPGAESSGFQAKLTAMRLGLGINYTTPNFQHSLSLTAEIGESNAAWIDEKDLQARLSFNYDWGVFNLSAEYQKGGFFLGQVLSNQALEKDYERWRINPNLRCELFQNKLKLEAGLSFFHESMSGNSTFFRSLASYELPYGLEVFAGLDYYEYGFSGYSTRHLEFGIIKHFSTPSIGINNNDLSIFIYKEINGDGIYTEGIDEIAVGQLIYIDKKAFRTNAQGMIKYRKIPKGVYRIRFDGLSKWYAPDREIEVKEDAHIDIGMNKMTTIKGNISYNSTILSYEIDKILGGLAILAIDKSGKTYSTRTMDDGSFVLFVPNGNYTISLITPKMMEYVEVTDNGKKIETTPEHPTMLDFNIKVKEKRVEYKKFTSTQ